MYALDSIRTKRVEMLREGLRLNTTPGMCLKRTRVEKQVEECAAKGSVRDTRHRSLAVRGGQALNLLLRAVLQLTPAYFQAQAVLYLRYTASLRWLIIYAFHHLETGCRCPDRLRIVVVFAAAAFQPQREMPRMMNGDDAPLTACVFLPCPFISLRPRL